MKHINEILNDKLKPYKSTIKQLSTKLKKANQELKLREMEQLMDYYHIQRLESKINQLKRNGKKLDKKYFKNMIECNNELVVFQVGLVLTVIAFIFYIIVQ